MTHPFSVAAAKVFDVAVARCQVWPGITFADALAACGDAGAASHALFFLVLLKRLGSCTEAGVYPVLSDTPVGPEEWEAFLPRVKRVAQAVVSRSQATNERGYPQDCVTAQCSEAGYAASSWGATERSATRSLMVLNDQCPCEATNHRGDLSQF